jgi:hypothetical protein
VTVATTLKLVADCERLEMTALEPFCEICTLVLVVVKE